jgi:hypothetical protein
MIACGPLLGLLQAASPGLALLKGRTPCWQSLESGAINAVVFTEYTLYGSLQELSRDRVFSGCIASSYLSSQGHHCTRCKLHLKLRQAMRCLGARVTKLNVYDSIKSQSTLHEGLDPLYHSVLRSSEYVVVSNEHTHRVNKLLHYIICLLFLIALSHQVFTSCFQATSAFAKIPIDRCKFSKVAMHRHN